jgi:hypothetical protein
MTNPDTLQDLKDSQANLIRSAEVWRTLGQQWKQSGFPAGQVDECRDQYKLLMSGAKEYGRQIAAMEAGRD